MPPGMADLPSWQASFVATTFALGDTVDAAQASLTQGDLAAAASVVAGLTHPAREVRARTLAAALGRLAVDLESARLA